MAKDSAAHTLLVAFLLCVVCSVLVSAAAVTMKPRQVMNQEMDIRTNLLRVAGLIPAAGKVDHAAIEAAYKKITPVVIDLATGKRAEIDPAAYDPEAAAKDPATIYRIPAGKDLARIRTRSRYALVYLVREGGRVSQIVLRIHGKGLYSTLYGFLALAADTRTVKGLAFYSQGETPGLGGEVDNPRWKAKWPGKTVYDDNWQPNIRLVKGGVPPNSPGAGHEVDALSGASMTSRGVQNLLLYWLGEDGYGPFLKYFREHGGEI